MATFSESGLSFQYPENWPLERDEIEGGWGVTVQSPGASFMMISWRADCPPPDELAEKTLDDLSELYPEIETEPNSSPVAGRVAFGYELRFFMFDLVNTCWIRTFRTANATVLVMWQINDLELESYEPVMRAMVTSLQVDERAAGFEPGLN